MQESEFSIETSSLRPSILKKKTSCSDSPGLDLSAGEGTTRVFADLSTKNLVSRLVVIHSVGRESSIEMAELERNLKTIRNGVRNQMKEKLD